MKKCFFTLEDVYNKVFQEDFCFISLFLYKKFSKSCLFSGFWSGVTFKIFGIQDANLFV